MMGSQLFGNDTEHYHDTVVDENVHMAIQEDHDNIEDQLGDDLDENEIDDSDSSHSSKSVTSDGSTKRKIIKIEKKIQSKNLCKKERRLL